MRMTRALGMPLLLALLLLLAACGGAASPSADDGNTEPSTAAEESEAPAPSEDPGNGNGNGNGNGGSNDVEGIADDLVPPNSTETSRTTAAGGIFVSYESSDSVESLTDFYEGAIAATGMTIFSTSTISGSVSWIFAEDEGASFGGSVTVTPSQSGGGGSTVIITIASDG